MMEIYPVKIAGIGAYIPENGVATGKTQSQIAAIAVDEAMKQSGLDLNDIDVIVNASETFERIMPEGATILQAALGLGHSGIPCMTVQSGWQSFMQALVNSMCWIANGRFKNILIVASEIYSHIVDPEDERSSHYYKDAACAVVVVPALEEDASALYKMVTSQDIAVSGAETAFCMRAVSSGKQGKELYIHLDLEALVERGSVLLKKLKTSYTKEIDDIKYVIGQYLNMAFLKDEFRDSQILSERAYAGCGNAEIPLILYRAIKDGVINRGDAVLLTATGTGITSGMMKLIY